MAIVDAYIIATLLSKHIPNEEALRIYDAVSRKQSVQKVIEQARFQGSAFVSPSRMTCWLAKLIIKWIPVSWLIGEMVDGDSSNRDFLESLDREFPLENRE